MNRKFYNPVLFVLCAFILAATSCKKEKDQPASPNTPAEPGAIDYLPLKTGNYWIYNVYQVNLAGKVLFTGVTDSVYVAGDTVIRSKTYHTLVKPITPGTPITINSYFRDSAGVMLYSQGSKYFSLDNFSGQIRNETYLFSTGDTLGAAYYSMGDKDFMDTVPAGIFKTVACKGEMDVNPAYSVPGMPKRFYFTRFAKGVGITHERLVIDPTASTYMERQLVRYSVK